MAEDGSSGPRAPEPAHDDSHEGDRHEAPRGRGASRPKGDGGAKGKGKAKVRAAQGKGPSPAKGKKSLKGKAPAQSSNYRAKGTEGIEGARRRSAFLHRVSGEPAVFYVQGIGCNRGDKCRNAHNWQDIPPREKKSRCMSCGGVGHQRAACPHAPSSAKPAPPAPPRKPEKPESQRQQR